MSSRIRFSYARQVFDAFKPARHDVTTVPADETPLEFVRKLANSSRPMEAIAFGAYLLPRREAVWWGCQCVRAIHGASGDAAMAAAEAWVRDPEETTRRAALDLGASGDKRLATTWLASAAGWSGGNMAPIDARPFPAPQHLTAKAVLAAIVLAIARVDARDQPAWIVACADACLRFAEGEDARPRLGRSSATRGAALASQNAAAVR